jgi:hypothetical protein
MKSPLPTVEQLLVLLGGLALSGCDKKPETPQAEPTQSAAPSAATVASAPAPAEPPKVEAKEVKPATSASGGKEKKCAPGGCAPGACG